MKYKNNHLFYFLNTKLAMRNEVFLALLTVSLLACLAAFPFFNHPGLPAMTDAELHVVRIAEIGYSIQQGHLYPRWAPDFYHGYGYPIFNYYAPLTYHLGYYLSLGQPENAAMAAKLLFIGSIFLGAYGAFYLGSYFSSRGGGLLGSVVYIFSPYILLTNPHSRGDLAEVLALAFLPWVLYFWQKLWHNPSKTTAVLTVFFTSATLLSHNLTGLTMLFILLCMAAYEWFILKNRKHIKAILSTAVVFILITSFFWMPFLLERKFILLDVAGEGHYDFRNHFVRFREVMSLFKRFDYRDSTMAAPFSAGPLQVFLVFTIGVGNILMRKQRTQNKLMYLFLCVLFLFLITPVSLPVWEYLPGLVYFQFPWRFLGPFAVVIVPVIASGVHLLEYLKKSSCKIRSAIIALTVGIIVLFSLPGLYPIPWESGFGKITKPTIIEYELKGRWRGTTSTDDFVPSTVDMIPRPSQPLLDSYIDPPIDRVNRLTLPENTEVTVLEDFPNHFTVKTDEPFLLRLMLFYFPGWKAYINGVEQPIEIAHPEGFISVHVPIGEHDILVKFENSTDRSLSWWFSAAGLILGLGLLIVDQNSHKTVNREPGIWLKTQKQDYSVLFIFGIVLFCLLLNVTLIKPGNLMSFESEQNIALPAEQKVFVDFGNQLALLGYDIFGKSSKKGQTLEIELYWQATNQITETYQSFVHIMNVDGQILTQSDHLNPGGYPTNLWSTEKYIRDKHMLTIPDNAVAGRYPVHIGIYSLNSNTRLEIVNPDSREDSDFYTLLDQVEIRR